MKFTEDHEWLRVDGDVVIVGITEHAAEQLGDVVFVELPEADRQRHCERIAGHQRVRSSHPGRSQASEGPLSRLLERAYQLYHEMSQRSGESAARPFRVRSMCHG